MFPRLPLLKLGGEFGSNKSSTHGGIHIHPDLRSCPRVPEFMMDLFEEVHEFIMLVRLCKRLVCLTADLIIFASV